MNRLIMAKKRCGQLASNDTYFADSWFSGVKTSEEVMSEGVYYCGKVDMSHKGFCIYTLEKLMKECPVGSYIVMKITPRFTDDRPLVAIGYK